MINAHTRRVGLMLATPSDSSSISNGGHPVIPVKRQLSEDLHGTYPQKKVARPVALDSGSRGHQAVSLKRKCSERFLDVHPPNKVARPAGGGPPGHLLAPLKRKCSLGTHSLNKVARIAAQGIDLALVRLRSNKVSSSHQQYLQGDDSIRTCAIWSLPNKLLILIAAYLPRCHAPNTFVILHTRTSPAYEEEFMKMDYPDVRNEYSTS
ncbi:hypothetical protein SCLCIDRAFT_32537 [Scleroderma citrinum Foug A]|uniref:Uncharacterized protein n=1 Tax=Scleroderma citrinum Foug A TaxID=1036808 RepID=A0A0C3CVJ1_9AGAM|nr:hypothetical protein SCLCIDRAFT_32537 [Scleroderma citrinum Foug A]